MSRSRRARSLKHSLTRSRSSLWVLAVSASTPRNYTGCESFRQPSTTMILSMGSLGHADTKAESVFPRSSFNSDAKLQVGIRPAPAFSGTFRDLIWSPRRRCTSTSFKRSHATHCLCRFVQIGPAPDWHPQLLLPSSLVDVFSSSWKLVAICSTHILARH